MFFTCSVTYLMLQNMNEVVTASKHALHLDTFILGVLTWHHELHGDFLHPSSGCFDHLCSHYSYKTQNNWIIILQYRNIWFYVIVLQTHSLKFVVAWHEFSSMSHWRAKQHFDFLRLASNWAPLLHNIILMKT